MLESKISGQNALYATFRKLPASTQNKAMRPALRKGGTVVAKAVGENIRAQTSDEATGLAARSIKVYSLRKVMGQLRIGVMVKKGLLTAKGVRVGLYVSVLEYGKNNQPPRPSFRKAAREKANEAFAAVEAEAGRRMDSAIMDATR